MSIGAMRERLTFQEPKKQPNGQGGFRIDKLSPVIIGEYWGAVEVISSLEVLKYGGKFTEGYIKITARKNTRLNNGCQVKWQGLLYDIEDIKPDKKPGYIIIFAREAV